MSEKVLFQNMNVYDCCTMQWIRKGLRKNHLRQYFLLHVCIYFYMRLAKMFMIATMPRGSRLQCKQEQGEEVRKRTGTGF